MQPLGPNQIAWLTELETTDAPQGVGALHSADGFCCLGIGCTLFFPEMEEIPSNPDIDSSSWFSKRVFAPNELVEKLALRSREGEISNPSSEQLTFLRGEHPWLVTMNDRGFTFAEIAAFIRLNPEAVFLEPR